MKIQNESSEEYSAITYIYGDTIIKAKGGQKRSNGKNKDLINAPRPFRIEYIENDSKRRVTCAKRKKGLMKKAQELSILTDASILCIVINDRNEVSMFVSERMKIIGEECKKLIQQYFSMISN